MAKKNIKITRSTWGTFSNISSNNLNEYYLLITWKYHKGKPILSEETITVEQCQRACKRHKIIYKELN